MSSQQEEMLSLPKKEDVARMEVQLEAVTKETAAKQQVSSHAFQLHPYTHCTCTLHMYVQLHILFVVSHMTQKYITIQVGRKVEIE